MSTITSEDEINLEASGKYHLAKGRIVDKDGRAPHKATNKMRIFRQKKQSTIIMSIKERKIFSR
jgi:hypothetical protein